MIVDMRGWKMPGDKVRKTTAYVLERKCVGCGDDFIVANPQRNARTFCGKNICKMRRRALRAKTEKAAAKKPRAKKKVQAVKPKGLKKKLQAEATKRAGYSRPRR